MARLLNAYNLAVWLVLPMTAVPFCNTGWWTMQWRHYLECVHVANWPVTRVFGLFLFLRNFLSLNASLSPLWRFRSFGAFMSVQLSLVWFCLGHTASLYYLPSSGVYLALLSSFIVQSCCCRLSLFSFFLYCLVLLPLCCNTHLQPNIFFKAFCARFTTSTHQKRW